MTKLSVLVVEDEFNTRLWITTIVQSIPEVELVIATSDYATAVEAFNKTHPNVIITDLHLPDKDGLELIKYIRSSGSRATIIVLTGNQSSEANVDIDRLCRKVGADEFIEKCHNPLPIRGLINRACQLQKKLMARSVINT